MLLLPHRPPGEIISWTFTGEDASFVIRNAPKTRARARAFVVRTPQGDDICRALAAEVQRALDQPLVNYIHVPAISPHPLPGKAPEEPKPGTPEALFPPLKVLQDETIGLLTPLELMYGLCRSSCSPSLLRDIPTSVSFLRARNPKAWGVNWDLVERSHEHSLSNALAPASSPQTLLRSISLHGSTSVAINALASPASDLPVALLNAKRIVLWVDNPPPGESNVAQSFQSMAPPRLVQIITMRSLQNVTCDPIPSSCSRPSEPCSATGWRPVVRRSRSTSISSSPPTAAMTRSTPP